LLPGLVLLKAMRLNVGALLTFALALPMSMALNYVLVISLIAIQAYRPFVMLTVFAFEVLAYTWLTRPKRNLRSESWKRNKTQTFSSIFGKAQRMAPIETLAVLIGLAVALSWMLRFLLLIVGNVGSVFVDWDPALIWNLRATQWAANVFPGFFYN